MTTSTDDSRGNATKRLTIALAKIGLAMRHQTWQAAEHARLSPTQGQILVILHKNSIGLRLSQIAELLGVSVATTSDAVSALQRKLLVNKVTDATDRRATVVALTQQGMHQAHLVAQWPDFLLAGLEELTDQEQAVFLRGMTKIIRTMQENKQIPVSKMCVTCKYFVPNAHNDMHKPHHCEFVDSPFGDRELRFECDDHEHASEEILNANWIVFKKGKADNYA